YETATRHIYSLSLHAALPISGTAETVAARTVHLLQQLGEGVRDGGREHVQVGHSVPVGVQTEAHRAVVRGQPDRKRLPLREGHIDRKSTRLNSSHVKISYAVF